MADELQSTPRGPRRLLGGQVSVTPFLLGVGGTAAFVGSLVLDWEHITITQPGGIDPGFSSLSLSLNLGVPQNNVGLVYLLGVLALIAAAGTVLARPKAALRARLPLAGLAVGLLAVQVSVPLGGAARLLSSDVIAINLLYSPEMRSTLDAAKVGYEPGIFCAFAAIVLLAAAVWLAPGTAAAAEAVPANEASRPARPDAAPVAAPPAPLAPPPSAPPPSAPPPSRIGPTGRAGFADGLTVTPSHAIEPSSSTDILRS